MYSQQDKERLKPTGMRENRHRHEATDFQEKRRNTFMCLACRHMNYTYKEFQDLQILFNKMLLKSQIIIILYFPFYKMWDSHVLFVMCCSLELSSSKNMKMAILLSAMTYIFLIYSKKYRLVMSSLNVCK